jgi:hypothetical protein
MLSYSLRKYDSAISRFIQEVQRGLDKTDPLLGQIQSSQVVHGGKTRQVTEPKKVETPMRTHKADVVIQLDWYRKTDVRELVIFLYGVWETFASKSKKALFETLSLTTEAVGNSIPLNGRNVWDAQIEMLKQMHVRFDEDGNHHMEFVVHPDTYKKLAENPPTPEQRKRWDEVMNAKREEYYAKKRTRRLF